MTARPPRRPAVVVDAVRVDGRTGLPEGFSYTVLIDPNPRADDRRGAPRRRTRLRSGKVVDAQGTFVTECLVHDLSGDGMRLKLPPGTVLPTQLQVYDDQSGLLRPAEVSWHRAGEAGIRLMAASDTPRNRTVAADMRRKFYKLPR